MTVTSITSPITLPVYSVNEDGQPPWSSIEPQPGPGKLAAPVLSVGTPASTSIPLSWTFTDDGQTGFEIERSPNGTDGWIAQTSAGAAARSATASGLTAETDYWFRIRAVDSGVPSRNSNWSNVVTGRTAVAPSGYTPAKLMRFTDGALGGLSTGTYGMAENVGSGVRYANDILGPYGSAQVGALEFTSDGQHGFGGSIINFNAFRPSEGSECWIRVWHYFPTEFCFQNNAGGDQWGQTKWIRYQWGSGATRLTHQIGNWSASVCNTHGSMWGTTAEGNLGTVNLESPTKAQILRGGWRCLEWNVLFSTNPSLGRIRSWVDDTYCGEVTGKTMASTENLSSLLYGDYINGGGIAGNRWYIDEVIITFEPPDDVDASGRPRIGVTKRTEDFN